MFACLLATEVLGSILDMREWLFPYFLSVILNRCVNVSVR